MSDRNLEKVTATDPVALASPSMTRSHRALRVLIIQPPSIHGVRSLLAHVDNEGGEGMGYKPPLGILYIGSMVAARSPHQVRLIDAIAESLSFDDVVARAREFDPHVVGISAWTDFWYPAYVLGKRVKAALPHAHLTYGGPHVGIFPQETLNAPFVDSVIVGDGETPFLYLCNLVANGVADNSFPGLHFKTHGVKPEPNKFFIERDLDLLPLPDRTLLSLENYSSILGKGGLVTTMITSRGCPYRCTFCKLTFQKNLARSADNVLEEFRRIQQLGIREVEIYDDTFTWSIDRLKSLCEKLIQADLGIEWAIRDRVSSRSVDSEIYSLMKRAGCRRIHFGIESGVQSTLDKMNKRITVEQARRAVRLARETGLTVLTYFMLGNLDETSGQMRETVDFAIALEADFAEFSITIPYAGTEMYEVALRRGIITRDYWSEYARDPVPDFSPPELIENLVGRPELLALHDEAVRRFYFRPKFLLRNLLKVKSAAEFTRKARMGLLLARSVFPMMKLIMSRTH